VFGGIVLDLSGMQGVVSVDATSGVVEVLPGTFGPQLEAALEPHGLSVGHFPQSFDIATVGGWVACRGAGQYSTRYGKIEDMVVGLEVVLADGSIVLTGGAPAAAAGPDLTQVFVGSEGTLGIVTRIWLRTHPAPLAERRASYAFGSFQDGLEACRRILRRGATPAVLRLYDAPESQRGQGGDGVQCMLLVLDEGDPVVVDATMTVVAQECAAAADLGTDRVDRWMHHRNDTSALQALTHKGFVVDTLEIAWAFGLSTQPRLANDEELDASVDFDPYRASEIGRLIDSWTPLSLALNSLNRAMGQPDVYPFVLSAPVIEKLGFIHRIGETRWFGRNREVA
jgi:alkyldihydroxyacetonephosphate synthase